jgi:hypothetical protein
MAENPFGFLLELSEDQGKEWLRRFLRGEGTSPPVRVPFDLQPLEFLLGRINPLPDSALPLRVGTLAASLLAEAITRGAHRAEEPEQVEAFFTLVESLPVPETTVEFLIALAATGRLLSGPPATGPDLHLLTLRALVLHQRALPGEVKKLIRFWEEELDDLRYAAVAIQGLLRVSVAAGIRALPEFVRRARGAKPPIPLVNTLFVVSEELTANQSFWADLVRAFDGESDEFQSVTDTFAQMRLPETNPDAWAVLQTPIRHATVRVDFSPQYARPEDASKINSACQRLVEGMLLRQAA